MLPVSAPPRIRERLRAAPDGPVPVVHRGRDAVYLDVAGSCVGLVSAAARAVPVALRSRCSDLGAFPARAAYLRDGLLHLDGTPLRVGRVVDVSAPRLGPDRIPANKAGSITDQVIPPAPVVEFALSAGLTGPIDAEAAARLVGRGEGLTPLGDDLLCGWLAAHRAAGVATPDLDAAVRRLAPRTTLLSAGLLDCALHGEVLPELGAWLAAVGTPAEPVRAAALLEVGHTSGAGLLHGARLALATLHETTGVAA